MWLDFLKKETLSLYGRKGFLIALSKLMDEKILEILVKIHPKNSKLDGDIIIEKPSQKFLLSSKKRGWRAHKKLRKIFSWKMRSLSPLIYKLCQIMNIVVAPERKILSDEFYDPFKSINNCQKKIKSWTLNRRLLTDNFTFYHVIRASLISCEEDLTKCTFFYFVLAWLRIEPQKNFKPRNWQKRVPFNSKPHFCAIIWTYRCFLRNDANSSPLIAL